MATYDATRIGGSPGARVGIGDANAPKMVAASFALTAALAAADVIRGVVVPKGATLFEVWLMTTDVDSGAAITFNVGTAASASAFLAGSTVGQAGGTAKSSLTAPVVMTADTVIQATVGVSPTGGAITSGTVTIVAIFQPKNG